jgi:DnaJ-class molecular chaperone
MKRSFYEVLNIQPDADREQLDAAYRRATRALEASKHRRGTVESAIEWNLLQDGYQILSHPARRARYDAKLAAARSNSSVIHLPEVAARTSKPRKELVLMAAFAVALSAAFYTQMVQKIDEVQIEHRQAVAKKKEEQGRTVSLDSVRSMSINANGSNGLPR